jgi:hypothetical protein
MKSTNSKIKFWMWALVAVVAILCSACSTDNGSSSNQGQAEATKPPPQVRVETLPTLTPIPVIPTETGTAPTVEPTAQAAQGYEWQPPDIDAQADSIAADIADIQNQLKNQKFILKP